MLLDIIQAPVHLYDSPPVRVLLIGGDHPRHRYYFNMVTNHPGVRVVGAIIQSRGEMIPPPPPDTNEHDAALWTRHFTERADAERRYFGLLPLPYMPLEVTADTLNSDQAARYVDGCAPDVALVFGCGMIRNPLADYLPMDTINLHLGLSPRYRGAATLFWPFYFLEPNHAGATFHRITTEPDAGEILHQSRPRLFRGDTLHDVSCRAVVQATSDMLDLLDRWPAWTYKEQRNTGKCFLARDFQPAHLRAVYDVWGDGIVSAYLNGEIAPGEPVLWQDNLAEVRND